MISSKNEKTLIVIGGGASGFFCAVNAARMNPTLKVIILEKTNKLLSKVKISGGGRCNVTNACFDLDMFSTNYPRGSIFLKKAFYWFNNTDTIEWFKERAVLLKKEPDNRMFPYSNTSQTIVDCLLKEAEKYQVEVQLNKTVSAISVYNVDNQPTHYFSLRINDEMLINCDYLCIATGGYAKLQQFEWLTSLGHPIEPPVPSLFTFNLQNDFITNLMGLSVSNVIIKIANTKLVETGPILITHWGLSGPAVLKLSAWGARILAEMNYCFNININWLPTYNEQTLYNKMVTLRTMLGSSKIRISNPFGLPSRLWNYFLEKAEISTDINWADLTAKNQRILAQMLTNQLFEVKGKTGFKEEFVTCGGVSLNAINVNTMESKIVPKLFFAGEVLNIDGITGGFNFQNAWTTGWIAASAIAKDSL